MSNFQYISLMGDRKVEAVQFQPEDQDLTRAWPRWFVDLLIDGRIMRQGFNGPWYLDKAVEIQDGDWIIWDGNEHLQTWRLVNELFIKRYRPAAT